jgi:hypothetical protein
MNLGIAEFCEYDLEDDDCTDSADFSPEQEKQLVLFATSFFGELKYIAKKYINDFFAQESFHQGGKIPRALLNNNSNISMVINYNINTGVDQAYHCLKQHGFSESSSGITEDIMLVVNILNKLSAANVPQQFAGGMILLYLNLVEGVDIGQ